MSQGSKHKSLFDCVSPPTGNTLILVFAWNGFLPPLPPGFAYIRACPIDSDHCGDTANPLILFAASAPLSKRARSLIDQLWDMFVFELAVDHFSLISHEKQGDNEV